MKKITLSNVLLFALTLTSANAFAYRSGDLLVRTGFTNISPQSDSTNILRGDSNFEIDGIVAGEVYLDSDIQLGLNVAYFLSDKWNLEIFMAAPFSSSVSLKNKFNFLEENLNLGAINYLPVTITTNYFFADNDAKFQPYLGFGLNYTVFFDEKFSDDAISIIQDLGDATVSKLSLDASFGLSAQIGIDYEISDGIFLNLSSRYISIDTSANFNINQANRGKIETVKINPFVYTISIGFKF